MPTAYIPTNRHTAETRVVFMNPPSVILPLNAMYSSRRRCRRMPVPRTLDRRASLAAVALLGLGLQTVGCGGSGAVGFGCGGPTADGPATVSAAPPAAAAAPSNPAEAVRLKLIERGKSLELPTSYEPPPGDAL